jgi:hypothetical protein
MGGEVVLLVTPPSLMAGGCIIGLCRLNLPVTSRLF